MIQRCIVYFVRMFQWRSITILLLLSISATSFAWGPTGHRAIGHVAEQHLSKKAQKAIKAILGNESLAIASTYMDEVRADRKFDHTHDWHWVTIPDGSTYAGTEKNPDGDLIEAIERMKISITDENSSIEEKRRDLRFLIHLIGDLHQPLHIGRGDDRGGNEFKVKWMNKSSNLHRVWDSGIIDLQKLSYTELAESLDPISSQQKAEWQQGTTEDWAHEAMQYRDRIYAIEEGDRLGYGYAYEHWPLVREQLNKAAIRLAGVLNTLFG